VRYLFGAYDVHAGRLHGPAASPQDGQEVLGFYRQIRMRYRPKVRIYLIADNLSAHKTPDIRQWAEANNVELVFTPTYASPTATNGSSKPNVASSSLPDPMTFRVKHSWETH